MSLAGMKVRGKHDAPNSTSAYALYTFERRRQGGFPHGLGPGGRVSAIAKGWKALSEELKAVCVKQSEEDWAKRHKHMQEYCNFTLGQPVMDLKLMAPFEADANLNQGTYAAIHTWFNTNLVGFAQLPRFFQKTRFPRRIPSRHSIVRPLCTCQLSSSSLGNLTDRL